MAINSYIDDEVPDIFEYVRARLKHGPCDNLTLSKELKVDADFLSTLLWNANSKEGIDFCPCKSETGNIMWELFVDDEPEPVKSVSKPSLSTVKQVICMRKDLKMRRGKEIAQGSHASMKFLADKLRESFTVTLSPVEQAWLSGKFAKITVQVNSATELLELHAKAQAAGLVSCLIQDAGATEFAGVPTYTCIAIGPDYAEKIDPITGQLPLY